ncbi:MAG: FIST C-terminal domain-containing protein [Myxococcales bacterium]|nr:FIST C-terminal domain-containing protein [Myxococcales bacterium]
MRALHGASSCLGVMTEAGVDVDGGLGLFGVRDPEGSYGVGLAVLGDDPAAAAAAALQRAIDAADRQGEVPAMIWLTAAPGSEETCIAGIEGVLGRGVPIVGGSAADDAVAGGWYLLSGDEARGDAVVVTALFPSTAVSSAFQSGYAPTERRGRVTAASGRTIEAIDGAPAAQVYDAWTGGAITSALAGGSVLASTTLFPIGRRVGEAAGAAYYRLAHPESVTEGGGLHLFADVEVGDELVLMSGTTEALRSRAGRVAADALALARRQGDAIAGALVIFCAGCMLTIRDDLDDVVAGLREALGEVPFLGAFTFGEQGCFVGGENCHGNLMISVTVFSGSEA